MRQTTGLGPEWQRIWVGAAPAGARDHLCTGLPAPADTYPSEWVRVRSAPTATRGVAVAECERCRTAWVRTQGPVGPAAGSAAGMARARRGRKR